MRIHVVESGIVTNTILAESVEEAQVLVADLFPGGIAVSAETGGSIGDLHDAETGVFTPPAPQLPDPAAQKRLCAEAVQRHLDATVQARDYADIATCVTYADEPAVPRYQAEGQAARAWRSLVWAAVHEAWRSVEAGERDAPSVEALIAELPVIVWP